MCMDKKFAFLMVLLIVWLVTSLAKAEPVITGQNKAAITQCMGKPDRVITKSGKSYLTYYSAKEHCQVTFKLRNDAIHHVFISNLFGQRLPPTACPIAKFDCISQQKVS